MSLLAAHRKQKGNKKNKRRLKIKDFKEQDAPFLFYGGNLYAQSSLLKLNILKASLWS